MKAAAAPASLHEQLVESLFDAVIVKKSQPECFNSSASPSLSLSLFHTHPKLHFVSISTGGLPPC